MREAGREVADPPVRATTDDVVVVVRGGEMNSAYVHRTATRSLESGFDPPVSTSVKDVEGGPVLAPGEFLVVGNEVADPAVAEVVSIDDSGIVLVRVLPGRPAEHLHLLRRDTASAS